jgi:hypothetical protein
MTCGVVCACDDVPAKCIAVRAVVASSNKRSFVMMVSVPGKFLAGRFWREGVGGKVFGGKSWRRGSWRQGSWQQRCHQGLAINEQALGRIVAGFRGGFVFISEGAKPRFAFVHYAFRGSFQTVV